MWLTCSTSSCQTTPPKSLLSFSVVTEFLLIFLPKSSTPVRGPKKESPCWSEAAAVPQKSRLLPHLPLFFSLDHRTDIILADQLASPTDPRIPDPVANREVCRIEVVSPDSDGAVGAKRGPKRYFSSRKEVKWHIVCEVPKIPSLLGSRELRKSGETSGWNCGTSWVWAEGY